MQGRPNKAKRTTQYERTQCSMCEPHCSNARHDPTTCALYTETRERSRIEMSPRRYLPIMSGVESAVVCWPDPTSLFSKSWTYHRLGAGTNRSDKPARHLWRPAARQRSGSATRPSDRHRSTYKYRHNSRTEPAERQSHATQTRLRVE